MYSHVNISRNFCSSWNFFQTKVVEKMKTHILWSVTFYFPENRAVCEIIWKIKVEPDRPQMTIWLRRIACWMPKAINTHSGFVVLTNFPLRL
jgi:hypothetical protein